MADKKVQFNFSKRHKKIFEYFRYEISPKGVFFLQKTHSSIKTEKQFLSWYDQLIWCILSKY